MQQIKERPILFNTEMIKAILDGRKTQTRRVVKNPDKLNGLMLPGEEGAWCPYGQVGDRLWVRETWGIGERPCPFEGSYDGIEYKADEAYIDEIEDLPLYKVETPEGIYLDDYNNGKWRPSIYMPRWASRINLEITNIRVERVQDITEDDAIAEGIYIDPEESRNFNFFTAQEIFKDLWDSINEKRGYGWDINPWVWVVEFKVL